MKAAQQHTLNAFHRVQDFIDAHADTLGALATSAGRRELDASVSDLANFSTEQGSLDRRMAGSASSADALAEAIRTQYMVPISLVARARLRGVPDIAALTSSGRNKNGLSLVRAARAMATAAAPHAETLAAAGLPSDIIARLAQAAAALEAAKRGRVYARTARVIATKGIAERLRSGGEAVSILHAVISRQYAADKTFLAGWNSARRVGSSRRTAAATSLPIAAPVADDEIPTLTATTSPPSTPGAPVTV